MNIKTIVTNTIRSAEQSTIVASIGYQARASARAISAIFDLLLQKKWGEATQTLRHALPFDLTKGALLASLLVIIGVAVRILRPTAPQTTPTLQTSESVIESSSSNTQQPQPNSHQISSNSQPHHKSGQTNQQQNQALSVLTLQTSESVIESSSSNTQQPQPNSHQIIIDAKSGQTNQQQHQALSVLPHRSIPSQKLNRQAAFEMVRSAVISHLVRQLILSNLSIAAFSQPLRSPKLQQITSRFRPEIIRLPSPLLTSNIQMSRFLTSQSLFFRPTFPIQAALAHSQQQQPSSIDRGDIVVLTEEEEIADALSKQPVATDFSNLANSFLNIEKLYAQLGADVERMTLSIDGKPIKLDADDSLDNKAKGKKVYEQLPRSSRAKNRALKKKQRASLMQQSITVDAMEIVKKAYESLPSRLVSNNSLSIQEIESGKRITAIDWNTQDNTIKCLTSFKVIDTDNANTLCTIFSKTIIDLTSFQGAIHFSLDPFKT